MNELDATLGAAAREGPEQYYRQVLAQTRAVHERLTDPQLLVGALNCKELRNARELLPVALVLNDCTAVQYFAGTGTKVQLPESRIYKDIFGTDAIRFNVDPETLARERIDMEHPSFAPCFFFADGKEQAPLMKALLPFIERGSVVFQPARGVVARVKSPPEGPISWHVLGVDQRSPLNAWEPAANSSSRPTPMEMNHPGQHGATMFEVTLPFLKGVPFKELAALLVDETDLVTAFRAALRNTVRQAEKDRMVVSEIVNDVVQPKISLLERKLKSLQRIHRIKIGGAALGSVALAFTSASTGGIGAGLLAIASAGGFGLLTKEYSDYVAKRDELEQDPFYFLWKCRRAIASATRNPS
jgi:hypothetical protein